MRAFLSVAQLRIHGNDPVRLKYSLAGHSRYAGLRLNALSLGIDAEAKNLTGTVHSVFCRAANIVSQNGALLTLVCGEIGNLANAIRLATPKGFDFLAHIQVGQPAACRGGILRIAGSGLSVDLRSARLWHADLRSLQLDLKREGSARAWNVVCAKLLNHQRSSSLLRAYSALEHGMAIGDEILASRVQLDFTALLRETKELHAQGAATILMRLIGLGPGLTPAGDDFIVGYLAGLWSSASAAPSRLQFLSSLGSSLAQAAVHANDVSRTQIRCAVRGHFAEPLAALAEKIAHATELASVGEATKAALQVGSTSGADGVFGLLLGCIWSRHSDTFLAAAPRWDESRQPYAELFSRLAAVA
jgi:Protein of unknown function (DUF2877)